MYLWWGDTTNHRFVGSGEHIRHLLAMVGHQYVHPEILQLWSILVSTGDSSHSCVLFFLEGDCDKSHGFAAAAQEHCASCAIQKHARGRHKHASPCLAFPFFHIQVFMGSTWLLGAMPSARMR
jgi:hypothetical protein